jgi:single-strand DNA-binding protein
MINQCTIVGRLVADPESRQTPNGKSICNVRLAVDRKGREKETDFFTCVAFGQGGDALAEYATKGRLLGIVGKIQLEQYVNKEGAKQQTVKIIIDNWQLLDSKKEEIESRLNSSPPNPKPAGQLKVDDIDDPFADD